MKKAFTLLELIITIAVTGITIAILIPVISSIISKSKTTSALSDATNTLLAIKNTNRTDDNLMITVRKTDGLYIYALYSNDNLNIVPSSSNPYEFGERDDERAYIIDHNLSDDEPIDITNQIPDTLNSVKVFSATFSDICTEFCLSEHEIEICADERYTLIYDVKPVENSRLLDIHCTTDDESIATVSDGIIKGVSAGTTTVTVRYGSLTDKCTVHVYDWVDFDGNFAELKALVQDGSIKHTFLRLVKSVEISDYPDIFPIVIPQGKHVKIDLNQYYVIYSASGYDMGIYAMFVNDGGVFDVLSTHLFMTGDMYLSCDGNGSINTPLIENRNNGQVLISASGADGLINNIKGTVNIIGNKTDTELVVNNLFVKNAHDGKLNICYDKLVGYVENMGTMSVRDSFMEGLYIDNNHNALIYNSGTVDPIIQSTLNSGGFSENGESVTCILSSGNDAGIGTAVNCKFNIDSTYTYTNPKEEGQMLASIEFTAMKFEKGSGMKKLCGGRINGLNEEIVSDGTANIKGCIYGGTFTHKVPDELIANGCICAEEGKCFVVKKQV